MSTPDNTPAWLEGVAAAVTLVIGGCMAYLRKVFVTNRELHRLLDIQEERREKVRMDQHAENLGNFRNLFERLGKLEQSQARTEGMLSGRYPRLDR